MLKLVFALIVIIDGEEQPEKAYWSSIYVCSKYAEAIENQLTREDDARRRPHYNLRKGQVRISAYCVPQWVDQNTQVFDH